MSLRKTINSNTNAYLTELTEFLKIPSISTDPAHKDDVAHGAQWVADKLTALNGTAINIHQTAGHPIVTAQFGNDTLKPTVLVYGHYDVQPVGDLNEWHSPPFEPTIRDGKIFARGATDDKGQVFCYFKAIELLQAEGELPCNIKFLIEGSEEIGSKNLPEFITSNPDKIACDVALISDTSIIDEETPAITVGLRGHIGLQVSYHGPNKELHSGFFGGAIANPNIALAQKVAAMLDDKQCITLPNFYDNVQEYTANERSTFNEQPNFDINLQNETGVSALDGEADFTNLERIGIRPCLTFMSVHSGPAPGVVKGVIPPKTEALLGLRLVPGQNPEKIATDFENHFAQNLPPGITAETKILGASPAWKIKSFDTPAYQAMDAAYTATFGKKPVPIFCGGTIPIASALEAGGASPIFAGFGLGSDNLHSPNEHISIKRFQDGIQTLVHFFKEFGKTSPATPS